MNNDTDNRPGETVDIVENETPATGAVLVVGGGVAGMQASLDLAEAGYRAYVLEEQSALGGNMARVRSCWGSIRCTSWDQSSKSGNTTRVGETSLRNYCSMCTVPPQLADTGRHKDVDLILGATLEEVTGEPGNFRVRVKKKPRYVAEADCVGCGDCAEVCPVTVTSEFEEHRAERKAVYRLYPQATPSAFAIEKRGTAPCRQHCPAGVNVQAMVNLVGAGKFAEALEVLMERMPFPGACSHLCPRPCELACSRAAEVDSAVAVGGIAGAALEYGWDELSFPTVELTGETSVGIVGAGVAGLTVALGLMREGITVTLYDQAETVGGRTYGTEPELAEFASREAQRIVELGASFVPGTRVGSDIELDKLRERHGALVIATGDGDNGLAGAAGDDIFRCGEYVTGPTSVAEVVGDGWRTAEAVAAWLRGEPAGEANHAQIAGDSTRLSVPPNAIVRDIARSEPASREEAMEQAQRCLNCAVCSDCGECLKVCDRNAIRLDDTGEELELNVGAILLATGFDLFDARKRPEYGYGRYPNVVTSMEFERMLNLSGPTQGEVLRPSDGSRPKKLAFIQCVGSRELRAGGNFHCSAVCCLQSAKEAMVAQERVPGLETAVFYMDMRTQGKGAESYFDLTVDYGVRYERSMISTVKEVPGSRSLELTYVTESGERRTEEFDMVVLALAFEAPASSQDLAERLGVELNESGFVKTRQLAPNETTRAGVFAGGACTSPRDIPETAMDADSAAALAASMLSTGRGTLLSDREYPPERDVAYEPARVGVVVCRCGRDIGSVVDVPRVVEAVKGLPNVVCAEESSYACSHEGLQRIKELVAEYGLNRVVVSACAPRTHEPVFQDALREAGLNPFLLSLVDIRSQCAWVHTDDPERATEKARDLTAMAAARARYLEALPQQSFDVDNRGLVIGGGVAGMTAALRLAAQGLEVYLVEKADRLGGNAWELRESTDGEPVRPFLEEMIDEVTSHPRIRTYLNAQVERVDGYVGNFESEVRIEGSPALNLGHGVTIVATGAHEASTNEYLYGRHPAVVTQREFDRELDAGGFDDESIVFIQCVGSREPDRPYCSRVCCTRSLEEAIEVKKRNPAANVHVLMREMRSYGFREALYQEARRLGVLFTRFDVDAKPRVSAQGDQVTVEFDDPALGARRKVKADRLVLATAIAPNDNEALAQKIKAQLTDNGFFRETYANLYQTDTAAEGVFLCGLAHAPKDIGESMAQAGAAALRAAALLGKEQLKTRPQIAKVNERWCTGCGLCVEVCPYDARELTDEGVARVIEARCQGCGACAAACPSGATQLAGFTKNQIIAMVDELASGGGQ